MARKKKLFQTDSTFEGVLFGIVTLLRDYQLCWHLNKSLQFEMKMMDDLEITHKKKNRTAVFSWFKYEDDLDKLMVYLLSNKHLGENLIPEMKQLDFILMMQGEISEERKKEILGIIKEIHSVQLAMEIDYSGLVSKSNLILE